MGWAACPCRDVPIFGYSVIRQVMTTAMDVYSLCPLFGNNSSKLEYTVLTSSCRMFSYVLLTGESEKSNFTVNHEGKAIHVTGRGGP
jgi:hypothetical protein